MPTDLMLCHVWPKSTGPWGYTWSMCVEFPRDAVETAAYSLCEELSWPESFDVIVRTEYGEQFEFTVTRLFEPCAGLDAQRWQVEYADAG